MTGASMAASDHPRMRGEDLTYLSSGSAVRGSPPHARGRQDEKEQGPRVCGITPACAGKTVMASFHKRPRADHPRMRGEDCWQWYQKFPSDGSPPHARGRRGCAFLGDLLPRITPACAGKTMASSTEVPALTDHPRMRGEDFRIPRGIRNKLGSPPHARGRRRRARARDFCISDHPRMRGEDVSYYNAEAFTMGSPPHARGRLRHAYRGGFTYGITPACAGKTGQASDNGKPNPDHPRMRGEDRH